MRALLLAIAFLILLLPLPAQTDTLVEKAWTLLEDYTKEYEAGNRAGAQQYLDRGIALLRGQERDTLLGKFHNLYTYWYYHNGQVEEALEAQILAAKFFRTGYGNAEPTAFAYHNVGYLYQNVLGRPDSAILYYRQALEIYDAIERPIDVADDWRKIGLVYLSQHDYPSALSAYQAGLGVLEEVEEEALEQMGADQQELYVKTLSWLYLNLAELTYELDDIRQLRIYLNYSQDVMERYVDRFPVMKREAPENQARLYHYLGETTKSIETYEALLADTMPLERVDRARLLTKLADVCMESRNYSEAIKYWNRLLNFEAEYPTSGPIKYISYHRQLASCYIEVENLEAAAQQLHKAEVLLPRVDNDKEAALLKIERARLFQAHKKEAIALHNLDEALSLFNFSRSGALSEIEALKSQLLYSLYLDQGEANLLAESEFWARKSLATISAFEAQTFQQRSFGSSYHLPTIALLQVLYERYQYAAEDTLLQEIYALLDANRGRSLKLGRQWNKAFISRHYSVEKGKAFEELENQRLRLLKKRYQLEEDGETVEESFVLSDSLVGLEQQLQALKLELTALPSASDKTPDIQTVQENLPDEKSAALLYISGENSWFVLAICKRKLILHQRKMDAEAWQLLTTFSNFISSGSEKADSLGKLAFRTYQHLLAPVLDQLPEDINRLLISADGKLSTLPWAATCFETAVGDDYRNWPFLIRKYKLSFLPYIGEQRYQKRSSARGMSVGCFAPEYPDQLDKMNRPQLAEMMRDGYWALPGAQKEAKDIQTVYGTRAKLYQGSDVNAQLFTKRAGDHNILHLAMHAVADLKYPDESYLLFPGEGKHTTSLSTLDLLTLDLKADLMVLSACYAGDGPWRAGDGVMSLAYALQQTGVGTVLSNSWAMADQLSAGLMVDFHIALKAGEPLDKALQEAQLKYLEKAALPKAGHPFYWAGFRLQGDLSPIIEVRADGNLNWLWYLAGALVLFLVYRRISRARSAAMR